MLGGRAERNEYLLLHAFAEAGYVAPNKRQFKGGKKPGGESADNEGAEVEAKTTTAANKKAQYTGGLVLEPKKGFYDHYIVLLDFNSLYPSIIQEFNICFTTVAQCYEEPVSNQPCFILQILFYYFQNENGLPEPPNSSLPAGILPAEISNLVRNRRNVKAQMKRVSSTSDEYLQFDIRQKGLKLTANSMYGCLGFGASRFCAKTLAAMVTSKGRELLSRTKEIVEKRGYVVVYGDTDSIMVSTSTQIHNDARRVADELRRLVNGGFKHVEMDVDGLFKRLLLLKKKKYAALTVSLTDENDVRRELKGLDIVRRDWSCLAREIGERVVDHILRSAERDVLVTKIIEALERISADIRANKLPRSKFEVLKQLTKAPKDYADAKSQPHVQVALRLNETKKANLRAGDVIKYVICEDGTKNSATQRAYHVDEMNENENLALGKKRARVTKMRSLIAALFADVHYYLSQQIHPVIMRLCEPFAELDSTRIAEALGLDASNYRGRSAASASTVNGGVNATESALFDVDLYEGFQLVCPRCKNSHIIRSPLSADVSDANN